MKKQEPTYHTVIFPVVIIPSLALLLKLLPLILVLTRGCRLLNLGFLLLLFFLSLLFRLLSLLLICEVIKVIFSTVQFFVTFGDKRGDLIITVKKPSILKIICHIYFCVNFCMHKK